MRTSEIPQFEPRHLPASWFRFFQDEWLSIENWIPWFIAPIPLLPRHFLQKFLYKSKWHWALHTTSYQLSLGRHFFYSLILAQIFAVIGLRRDTEKTSILRILFVIFSSPGALSFRRSFRKNWAFKRKKAFYFSGILVSGWIQIY